jgi:hypothetical protein
MFRFTLALLVVIVGTLLIRGSALARGQAQGDRPTGWGGGPDGYEVKVDHTVKHGGKASASLKRITTEAKPAFGTIVQAFKADDYRGKRLRLTGYVKSNEVEGWAGLWMRVDSEQEGTVAFDNMQDRSIKGTADWKKCEIILDLPESSSIITFGVLLAGKGQVWIDDLQFDVVGKDVKTTAKEIRPTGQKVEVPKDLPKKPRNLDFEQ